MEDNQADERLSVEEGVVEQGDHQVTNTAVIQQVLIRSKKGNDVLTYNGFLFWKHHNNVASDKTFWACVKQEAGSRYRIHTNIASGEVIKTMGTHNHEKSAISIPLRQFKQEIKKNYERDGYVFPVLYALLASKSQFIYEELLKMIRDMWPDFKPTSVSVDYEQAMVNALEAKFPSPVVVENAGNQVFFGPQLPPVQVLGCFFHLVQNLKKKLANHHLKGRYDSDSDFAIQCRMITSMAFVPPKELVRVFDELWEVQLLELEPLMLYFQKNYIGSVTRRRNREVIVEPRFSHSLWNVYERTLNGMHRTNNYAEAANHRIQCELDVCHPGIWNFIDCLRSVQQGRDNKFVDWQSGKRPKSKRTKYVKADAQILRIVESFATRSTEEYLKGISNNYDMDD